MLRGGSGGDGPGQGALAGEALRAPRRRLEARERLCVVAAALGMPDVVRAGRDATLRPPIDDLDRERVMDSEVRMERMRRAPRAELDPGDADIAARALAHRQLHPVDRDRVALGERAPQIVNQGTDWQLLPRVHVRR